ncbi:MAG: response regulator [Chthoniobacteraceae bacterium]
MIVEDDKAIRTTLTEAAGQAGYATTAVASGGAIALQAFKSDIFDVVVLDLELSRERGIDLLDEMLGLQPRTAVIMLAA